MLKYFSIKWFFIFKKNDWTFMLLDWFKLRFSHVDLSTFCYSFFFFWRRLFLFYSLFFLNLLLLFFFLSVSIIPIFFFYFFLLGIISGQLMLFRFSLVFLLFFLRFNFFCLKVLTLLMFNNCPSAFLFLNTWSSNSVLDAVTCRKKKIKNFYYITNYLVFNFKIE